MKKLKYILIVIFSLGITHSCLVDDETKYDLNDKGMNLAGFQINRTLASALADGNEYIFKMKVRVVGPTVMDLSSDVTLTVSVDPASTAIAGTHYRIDNPSVVLKASDNYLGVLDVTMITAGLVTPLAENPILILNAASATGDPMVTNNGKQLEITLNYACFSDFAGTYSVNTISSSGADITWTETITKIGFEQYLTQRVGTWNPPLNPNYGFIFDNACNVISVPDQDLADMYSNDVFGHKLGTVNPDTGVITIFYTIDFASGARQYTAVYTPI